MKKRKTLRLDGEIPWRVAVFISDPITLSRVVAAAKKRKMPRELLVSNLREMLEERASQILRFGDKEMVPSVRNV
jgi:hypothetical protein